MDASSLKDNNLTIQSNLAHRTPHSRSTLCWSLSPLAAVGAPPSFLSRSQSHIKFARRGGGRGRALMRPTRGAAWGGKQATALNNARGLAAGFRQQIAICQ
jgi:hypothetical protein